MRTRLAVALLVALPATALAAPSLVSQSDPHPGIHREVWVDSTIPARIHLIRIDLTSAEIAVYATEESDRGQKTTEYSDLLNAQVAINGGSFAIAGYRPHGLAMGAGAVWTNTADDAQTALLHFRRGNGERTLATISPPEAVLDLESLPEGTEGVLSGRPLLVRNGFVETQFDCQDPVTIACSRAPRTAVALSADGNTLWLTVVNGWQSASLGLTAAELATFLKARGAHMAVALDGGASSTLVVNGALGNTPSDGVERTVANHLAIKYGALPKGQLVGFLCSTPDIPACGQDPGLRVTGAQVTLDDNRTTPGTNGYYAFAGVTPRLACVTVKKLGYLTRVKCAPVKSGVESYNSVYMEMGVDQPDAGVPDDGGTDGDDGGPDGGPRPDGGFPNDGGGGGCCDARGDLGGLPAVCFLGVVVAWRIRRRPGTKG